MQAGADDRLTQRLEPLDVERNVVVDEKDAARASGVRVGDVLDHALDREAMKVAAAHLDDRAEAAVKSATARRFDDLGLAAHHGVTGQDAGGAPWRPNLAAIEPGDFAPRRLPHHRSVAKPETGDARQRRALLVGAHQLTKWHGAFAANHRV